MVMTMSAIDAIQPGRDAAYAGSRFAYGGQGAERNLLSRLWHFYCALAAKRRSRLALDELSAHLLTDIGVTEAEARREAAVPFWR